MWRSPEKPAGQGGSRREAARRGKGRADSGEDHSHRGTAEETRLDPRAHPGFPEVDRIKQLLRKHKLHSVCEEASCPNLGECFSGGTATFMIMGDICTRRCPFCDVGHGRPKPLDVDEPTNLAIAIADLRLKYVVITSVDRDDLRDGGAQHFADCLREIRKLSPGIQLETLVPDYRGRMDIALESPPTSRRTCSTITWRRYRACTAPRGRARTSEWSLDLLRGSSRWFPHVPTKSG